jgi:hypothetical protein
MLHNLLESLGYSPLITQSKYNDPTDEGNVRIIGINGIHFVVYSDFRSNRRNIKVTSEQFKKLSEGVKDDELSSFYYKIKDTLTDIMIEDAGYY